MISNMQHNLYILLACLIILCGCSRHKKPDEDLLKNLEIIDLSRSQLGLLNRYKNLNESSRDSVLVDSIFNVHSEIWGGYLGNTSNFCLWINKQVYPNLESWNEKAKKLSLDSLGINFSRIALETAKFLGKSPQRQMVYHMGPGICEPGGNARWHNVH